MLPTIKICSVCREEKSLDEFYNFKGGRFGKTSACKICHNRMADETRKRKEAGLPVKQRETARKPLADAGGEHECLQTKPLTEFRITKTKARVTVGSYCRSCHTRVSRLNLQKQRAQDPKAFWARSAFNAAHSRAKAKGLPFNIILDDVVEQAASGCCVYCDFEPSFSRTKDQDRRTAPSLDRLVPSEGYVRGNIVLACMRCNMIKNEATADDLKRLCERVQRLLEERKKAA